MKTLTPVPHKLPHKLREIASNIGMLEDYVTFQAWVADQLNNYGVMEASRAWGVSKGTVSLWALKLGVKQQWVVKD
jgi:hypothetical protein